MDWKHFDNSVSHTLNSTRFLVFALILVSVSAMAAMLILGWMVLQIAWNPDVIRLLESNVIILMIATLATVTLSSLLLKRLRLPLQDLEEASREIADGHYDVRVPHRRNDEFGEAADAFNTMAGAIEGAVTGLTKLHEDKNAFVSAVSHELRTPLTSVLGYTEFLEDGMGGPLTPDQQQYISRIKLGVNQVTRMVDDLLDFARLQNGTFQIHPEPCDIVEQVRTSCADLQGLADAYGVNLECSVPEQPVICNIDNQRIAQVIGNFVSNAVKFTPKGGTVRLSCMPMTVDDRPHAMIMVEDQGPGIDPEDLDKLFKHFSQLEAGKKKKGGTGLGLSIAKQIAEAHGGHVGARSVPGSGSIFWVILPIFSLA